MKTANDLTELIGKTPLVKINKLTKGNVYAKVESFNPTGSIKDRASFYIIKDAEDKELLNKDTVIIEATSGNFGIGLAMICAIKGYRLILTMPENMSVERQKLLRAYGTEIVLTDSSKGMQGAVDKAIELSKKYPDSFIPQQFSNPQNPQAHYDRTAKEIWEDTDGKVDIVIAGVGTGGTISGIAKGLKEKNPNVKIIAVEPMSSQVLAKGTAGKHNIQGIGANFVPDNFKRESVDEIFAVSDENAMNTMKELAKKEGLFCGISSGASMYAGLEVAKNNPDKLIVVILPDTGERYLSIIN